MVRSRADLRSVPEIAEALERISALDETLRRIDVDLRRGQQTLPSDEVRTAAASALFSTVDAVERAVRRTPDSEAGLTREFQRRIGRWLYRSRLFWRGRFKPHELPGDYRMLEWIYDLEESHGQDPEQPGIVNCLDYAFSQLQSVRGTWSRRHRLRRLVDDELRRRGALRLLDVACGGARYLEDVALAPGGKQLDVTCVDQDPPAIRFVLRRLGRVELGGLRAICGPIARLERLVEAPYDLILSAALLDQLSEAAAARALLDLLFSKLRAGGVLAVSNAHPQDGSAFFKRLVHRWNPAYRSEEDLLALAPAGTACHTERSPDGSFTYLFVRRDR